MRKDWELLPKLLDGTKTVESRWYKTKRAPWGRIKSGDIVYFKDSGASITVKATVARVVQYHIGTNKQALELMQKHAQEDLGSTKIPQSLLAYILNKRYAVFIWLSSIEETNPFEINKKGFGMQSAWLTVEDINTIKVKRNLNN